MINNHCYDFKLIIKNKGIFDNFVDATYILTLVGSDRQSNIDEQLKLYAPTKKIYIVYNKGYKKCDKILIKHIPPYDLSNSYLNTIDHSLKNNYNNILILEDDFIFSPLIKNEDVIHDIHYFFIKNKDKTFYYNLGTIPLIFYPNINIFNNTFRGFDCRLSHAIIYTKKIQIDIIEHKNNNIMNWDNFLTRKYLNYFYKYPLCYQLFTKTENQNYWCVEDIFPFHCFIQYSLTNNTIKILKLDKRAQPGFNIIYIMSFILNYLIFLIIIIIIIYILFQILEKKFLLKYLFYKKI